MIGIKDFKRLIRPIQKKLMLLIGRAIVLAITNSGEYQVVKVRAGAGSALDNVHRVQEYGLDSYPEVTDTTEALLLSPSGNREAAVVINIMDREKRPTDLAEGEVCLYTKDDNGGSHRIHLKAGTVIEIIGSTINLTDGSGTPYGVVTKECICAYTGNPHPDASVKVKAVK